MHLLHEAHIKFISASVVALMCKWTDKLIQPSPVGCLPYVLDPLDILADGSCKDKQTHLEGRGLGKVD